jgi:hypothetical protein
LVNCARSQDLQLYNLFGEISPASESPGLTISRPDFVGPGRLIGASVKNKETVLDAYPKLKAICAAVGSNPGMAKWLAERGPQGF